MLIIMVKAGLFLLMCPLGIKDRYLRYKERRNQRTLTGISLTLIKRGLDAVSFLD